MCIGTPGILWESLTTRLQCMEHRSLVLFNHRHQKSSDLIPCKGSMNQNKQETGAMFSVKETKACPTLLFLLTHLIFLKAYEHDFIMNSSAHSLNAT